MDAAHIFGNGDESLFASHIGRSSAKPVVAVIDEDQSSRKNLVRLIRAAGYKPAAFASATEFLRSGLRVERGTSAQKQDEV
jgi:hypothetical protein